MPSPEEIIKVGEVYYCENCKKVQPVELVFYNPDEDDEEDLLICMICKEEIGFIQQL